MRVEKNPGKGLEKVVPKRSLAGNSKQIVGANSRKGGLTSMPGTDIRAPKAKVQSAKSYSKSNADPFDYVEFGFGQTGLTGRS